MFETNVRTQDIYLAAPDYMKQINNNNIGRRHKALSKTFFVLLATFQPRFVSIG